MRRRHLVPGLAAALFAAFALLYWADRPVYFALLGAVHEHPYARPFLDTRFVTAQVECWSRGVDVYARNPCDPLGRTLDYSPLWLRLGFLARPDSWTPVFGLAIDAGFLAALFAMPWEVAGPFEIVVAVGAVVSWATAFGMERGNTDLVMFAAAVLYARLLMRSAPARLAGYGLVLGAGLLKFYPLVLLALLVRERARRVWTIGAGCALVLVAFVGVFHAELSRIGANMADGLFADLFGARSLPFGITTVLDGAPMRDAAGLSLGMDALGRNATMLGWALLAAMSGGCAAAAVLGGRSAAVRDMPGRIGAEARSLLLVGSVLSAGCFFGHQNIGYRALFLLLTVPGLSALVRVAPAGWVRLALRVTCVLVVLVLWDGIVSRSRPGWVVMQLSWWWIVCVLLGIVVALLGDDVVRVSGLGRRVRSGRAQRTVEG